MNLPRSDYIFFTADTHFGHGAIISYHMIKAYMEGQGIVSQDHHQPKEAP